MNTRVNELPGYTRESAMAERRIRHKASRLGYLLRKSRKPFGINNYCQFAVIEKATGTLVLGPRFDATFSDIEGFLNEHVPAAKRARHEAGDALSPAATSTTTGGGEPAAGRRPQAHRKPG
jgi:hypothetical protein